MGYTSGGELDDVNNDNYVAGPVSVGSVQIEAKVGLSRLYGREILTITNTGPNVVYYGPTGVIPGSGDSLKKGQFISLPYGDNIAVFLICASGQTATVKVQESG